MTRSAWTNIKKRKNKILVSRFNLVFQVFDYCSQ